MNMLSTTMHKPIQGRRRRLVLGAAGASLTHLAGCGGGGGPSMMGFANTPPLVEPAAPSGLERALPLIPLDPGASDGVGGRQFSLVAQRGSSQLLDGISTPTQGYNGALLGPALRLRAGERTTIRVRNALDEPTSAHWHGLVVPADVDGGPHQAIAPGASWEARFTVNNPASTCWFHPHVHGSTGRQVVSGLAGLLIIEDPASSAGLLPATWGVDDVVLVLQDKRFTAAGQIDYSLGLDEQVAGYTGDRLLVNGCHGPTWHAPLQWVRLRLLNGCNARIVALRLSNQATMLQVANEGGWLAVPVARATITLAPGERAEVLVDLSNAASGETTRWLASTVNNGMGMGMGAGMGGASDAEITALTMRASVPRQPGAVLSPPASLPTSAPVVAPAGATLRSFDLEGGMMGAPFTINGRRFDINRIDFMVPAGSVEVWRFNNATAMAHPMHVHGVRMSMISRSGAAPAADERGLRDTFLVGALQTVALAVQTPAAASAVPLMFHCHILEHEDAGMMGQFTSV